MPLNDVPHVTILRPVKGLEPLLYECLAATFRQDYPLTKLTIYFCICSRDDAAYAVLERLLKDFSAFDATILVENEDPNLQISAGRQPKLGPNPKIRNLSRGYREARGDIVWVLDCNVWVGRGVAGRMVDKLCGFGPGRKEGKKFKFVHQLPLAVDVECREHRAESTGHLGCTIELSPTKPSGHDLPASSGPFWNDIGLLHNRGGRLEELFLASSHAKFYTAINTVAVAPCVVGKSNMFRRSHLNGVTSTNPNRSPGIDFFSDNICEDHLIGDLLWRSRVPEGTEGETWGKHALLEGDLAIQPMSDISVREYIARRVRWLRVRKFTVTLASFVEPGTESFLCSLYGAYGLTTIPWVNRILGIPRTWAAFSSIWLLSLLIWAFIDWTVYINLHSASTVEMDEHVPTFARLTRGRTRRTFQEWLLAWLGREMLALPIWIWAFWFGTEVAWRGGKFRVGMDMKVHRVDERSPDRAADGDKDKIRKD